MSAWNVNDLDPLDFVMRGSDGVFYMFGSGPGTPNLEGRDRATVAAVLRYWADKIEGDKS